jgi:hypothetical protein
MSLIRRRFYQNIEQKKRIGVIRHPTLPLSLSLSHRPSVGFSREWKRESASFQLHPNIISAPSCRVFAKTIINQPVCDPFSPFTAHAQRVA